eukprot:TRINITY_DN433_c0_g1_i6.p1 TRINITY_DN433_c0_g1~~TRINITY_DN433_c0_g1_i6.p1  ORF type:complete len:406 (-),score=255.73 TRINITY_DN433_c0_g1_i6:22-1239(-)
MSVETKAVFLNVAKQMFLCARVTGALFLSSDESPDSAWVVVDKTALNAGICFRSAHAFYLSVAAFGEPKCDKREPNTSEYFNIDIEGLPLGNIRIKSKDGKKSFYINEKGKVAFGVVPESLPSGSDVFTMKAEAKRPSHSRSKSNFSLLAEQVSSQESFIKANEEAKEKLGVVASTSFPSLATPEKKMTSSQPSWKEKLRAVEENTEEKEEKHTADKEAKEKAEKELEDKKAKEAKEKEEKEKAEKEAQKEAEKAEKEAKEKAEKAEKEAKEKAEKEEKEKAAKEAKEKEEKEKAEKEAKEKEEKEAKEKEEKEAKEKAEKEAKEKAEKEAKEKEEKEAKEKAEKEAKEKAEKEAKEKEEKEAKEKAEKAEKEAKEKAEKEEKEKKEKEAKEKEEKEKAEKEAKE